MMPKALGAVLYLSRYSANASKLFVPADHFERGVIACPRARCAFNWKRICTQVVFVLAPPLLEKVMLHSVASEGVGGAESCKSREQAMSCSLP